MIQKLRFTVLILLVPFLLLFFSLSSVVFNDALYAGKVSPDKLDLAFGVKEFLAGTAEVPAVFNEREKSHLADVKDLICSIALSGLLLFFVFIFLLFLEQEKFKVFFYGLSATTLIILFLLFAYLIFPHSFDIFHQILFEEETWLFPPESLIVNLFSFEFFKGMFFEVFVRFLLLSLTGQIVLFLVKLSR